MSPADAIRGHYDKVHSRPLGPPVELILFPCRTQVKASFAVFWGLQYYIQQTTVPTAASLRKACWDDLSPACSVLDWHDLTASLWEVTRRELIGDLIEDPFDMAKDCAGEVLRLMSNVGLWSIQSDLPVYGLPDAQSEVETENFRVKAAIAPERFLDRVLLKLTVDISSTKPKDPAQGSPDWD